MRITNIDIFSDSDDRARILKSVLKWMANPGIQVGGLKSVGYGLVRIVEAKAYRYTVVNGELRREGPITLEV